MSEAHEILRHHSLKCTSCRKGILTLMLEAEHALSEHEIRNRLASTYDRTTFYRSFKTLLESGIIHKIVLDSQKVLYAIARRDYSKGHAHFHCNECNSVRCLKTNGLQLVELPLGYHAVESEIILHGTCNVCSHSQGVEQE